ncbi:type II toxin-antitoxin system RelE/ParE family toxin [cf. Phormidesmis sp. LEGE 11477]|nr:type II toxin-antitoxin system RelE/ParE family toxin [cf. Phormidesmis sp. LEGE 11477]MBE9063289.1 type II toxin-antitoxin system RelE/ParE family toxin [cf. Phormidesmis sp. LEGE 11477]
MYSIRFTEQADADLLGIYIYTYNTWNENQAIEYTDGLKATVNKLAENLKEPRHCRPFCGASRLPQLPLREPSSVLPSVWSICRSRENIAQAHGRRQTVL